MHSGLAMRSIALCGSEEQKQQWLPAMARMDADLEAIHTFEGTETMQTLIVGRDITGISAFA